MKQLGLAKTIYLSTDAGAKLWERIERSDNIKKMMVAVDVEINSFTSREQQENIVHVDRTFNAQTGTQANIAIDGFSSDKFEGFANSWVEYVGLSRAAVLVISNSFFGETAAEIGKVPLVYYGEQCIQVHL